MRILVGLLDGRDEFQSRDHVDHFVRRARLL